MIPSEKLAKQLKIVDYDVRVEEEYNVTKVFLTKNTLCDNGRVTIELFLSDSTVNMMIENFCNGKYNDYFVERIMSATSKVDIVRATRLESESDTIQNIDKIYGNTDIEIFNTVDGNFMNILVSNNEGRCISFMLKSE